jgi:TolA-binding protein
MLVFALGVQSCTMWDNFTTYFNRYYNAKVSFEEAELDIATNTKRELFDFKEPNLPSKAKTSLDYVIEKCSKILQFNTESDYFDASLFMIGRAYYFQGNYTKAIRKFRELESMPNSELKLDNSLWIAKAELQMRRFDVGVKILEEVKKNAEAEEREDLLYEALLTEIRYLNYRENYEDAIEVVKKIIEVSSSSETIAQLYYEMGKLYLKIEDYENAANSFAEVEEYSPTFDVLFLSRIEFAKVKKQLGLADESLIVLEELRSEEKFKDKLDQIELETANIYNDQNKVEEALDLYTIVDTTYPGTESSGIAAFKRAQIIEKDYVDLDSAEVLYKRVAQTKAPLELKNIASSKSKVFQDISKNYSGLLLNLREYSYVKDSTLYVRDSTLYANYFTRRDSLTKLYVEMKQLGGNSFDSTKYSLKEEPPFDSKPKRPTLSADSLITRIVKHKYEIANLYFGELEIADSAFYNYKEILNDYPVTRYQARTLYALGTYYLTTGDKEKADSLFNLVYDNYKEEKIVNAAAEKLGKSKIALNVDPAEEMFVSAEAVYDTKKYNEAIKAFYDVSKNHPKSTFAAKSLYTIGFILENDLQLSDSAASVYDSLAIKYNTSTYALSVKNKLQFFKQEKVRLLDSLKNVAKLEKDKKSADSLGISTNELDSLRLSKQFMPDSSAQPVINNKMPDKKSEPDEKEKPFEPNDKKIKPDLIKTPEEKFKRPGRPRGKG